MFNLEPPPGFSSEVGFNPFGVPITLATSIRETNGEYDLSLDAQNISQRIDIYGLTMTLWGNPWLVDHDRERGNCLNEVEPSEYFGKDAILEAEPQPPPPAASIPYQPGTCSIGDPRVLPPNAYLTLPPSCSPMTFSLGVSSWQQPGIVTATSSSPDLEGCEAIPFDTQASARVSNDRASSSTGFSFGLVVNQGGLLDNFTPTGRLSPGVLAPSPVRRAAISLPEEVTINPSVGAGLGVCTEAQYAAETPSSPPGAGCPNESKIGDFRVISPIVSGAFEGAIYVAAPHANPFDSLIAVYLVAKSINRGIVVKVAGRLDADPTTGSLTATFDRLPQLPYSDLEIHFREGQRSPLATPAACGAIATQADLTPWRDPGLVKSFSLPDQVVAGAGGGPCPSGLAPFGPQAKGGTLNSRAGAYTPFYLHLSRQVTEQEVVSYSASFPPGLLGKIAGIPYCPDAAIEAARGRSGVAERDHPSCPAASLIGHTYSGYGVGSVLAYAPGNLYLAGPYRGSSFSVVAIDSALVGPFDLGTVIVRSAIRVDPTTAQVSIDATGTDPIPHIVDGVPIHLRDVRVYVDRPNVTLNPTSCDRFSIASAMNGAGQRFGDISDDTLAVATAPFQAFDCASLGFKPRISMRLKGRARRGAYPSLRVVVRPRPGDANISLGQLTLPRYLFLEQSRIGSICTRAQFAARTCPPGSIYGHVRVFTPLLDAPMEGPAYLRSSGNTLPDLVFALHGQGLEVDVVGRIDSSEGGIRGTFARIPDAPVSRFVLRMFGGRRGVIVSAAKLCRKPKRALARFLGYANLGRVWHPMARADCKRRRHRTHGRRGPRHRRRHRRSAGTSAIVR